MSYVPCDNCGRYTDDGVLINNNGKRIRLCVDCSTMYEKQEEKNMRTAEEIAKEIRESSTWNEELLAELCCLAGLEKEWQEADGETFESVVYKASEILNVSID